MFAWNAAAGSGGAVFNYWGSNPTFLDCQFISNEALGSGGAVHDEHDAIKSIPSFENCAFTNNRSNSAGGAIRHIGGTAARSLSLRDCSFSGNVAEVNAGAVYCGAHDQDDKAIEVVRCGFLGNAATSGHGGGLYVGSDTRIRLINCRFAGNLAEASGGGAYSVSPRYLQAVNCLFIDNWAVEGGGVHLSAPQQASEIVNCTFAGNQADAANGGGGVWLQTAGQLNVRNSIFWNNRDNRAGGWSYDESAQIFVQGSGNPSVTYSCIEGLDVFGENDNIDADPQFAQPDQGDFHLRTISPCIGTGTNTGLPLDDLQVCGGSPSEQTPDLDCHTRVVPEQGTVDMGSYEYQWTASPDCNDNQQDDIEDILTSGSADCNGNWIPDECEVLLSDGCPIGTCQGDCLPDCNQNCVPDVCDIVAETSNDCQGDGIPDECPGQFSADCNRNCREDAEDVSPNCQTDCSTDCNANGIPDECEFPAVGRWDTDLDFDEGTLINVNHDDVSGQLQRNVVAETKPLPYIWIAASGRGTLVRINTESGKIEGEYYSAPVNHDRNPSRTTVDLDGSVWAGNRDDNALVGGLYVGSIVKIGLVIGGQRVNENRMRDDNGVYLKPPFDYCTCEDRDGDGLIRTSRGTGDILAWPNTKGVDTAGGASTAEDECILRFVRTGGTGVRTLAVDDDNNLWVGGYEAPYTHEKRNGYSGVRIGDPLSDLGAGGYGGLVAHAYDSTYQSWSEILWSAKGGGHLLRYVIDTEEWSLNNTHGNYGIGFDPLTSRIWHSSQGAYVYEINPLTNATTFSYEQQFANGVHGAKGVAVDNEGNVWIAEYDGDEILRLAAPNPPDPDQSHTRVGTVLDFSGTTGVAVDAAGKIWVSEREEDRASRIDPDDLTGGPAGTTDLTVPLGLMAKPYNYSDMTGMVGLHTSGTGTWTVVHDGGVAGTAWGTLSCVSGWSRPLGESEPPGVGLEIGVRAADTQASLALTNYTPTNGAWPFSISPPAIGRFVEIRVRFRGSYPHPEVPFLTPTLNRLTITPVCRWNKGDVNADGVVDGRDIPAFVVSLMSPSCSRLICSADIDGSGEVNLDDVPAFVGMLLLAEPQRFLLVQDCNGNEVPDANDIANQTSEDCNKNFIPDECDIDPADPDGNELVSNDLNSNDIPDECEADCNKNGVPDDKDIADETSNDVNANDIPDECEPDCNQNSVPDAWDVSQQTSEDCNANGVPDECEIDCNDNGVPDSCDVDPLDPDGNEEVSDDCNANGVPDECDLGYAPPRGSLDCNENGIPDECDIANCEGDPACEDCNENGFPDGCDIAAEISLDENENGIPDECEGGGDCLGGGEGGAMAEESSGVPTESDGAGGPTDVAGRLQAWAEFHAWSAAQTWGPDAETSGAEQFQAMTAKLRDLGLPVKTWPGPR